MNRPTSRGRRLGAVVGPALVGVLLLASCGGAESGATRATINLDSTSTAFVVRTPATTIPLEPGAATVGEDGRVAGIQEYTVQAGEYPLLLVARFDVTLEDLLGVNDWTDPNQFPPAGTVIRIPPGALPVEAAVDDANTTTGDTGDGEDSAASGTIPDAGDNCGPSKYTLEANDYPFGVAAKFDVTIEALNAANTSTQGYDSFFVGLEIVIPAKTDC